MPAKTFPRKSTKPSAMILTKTESGLIPVPKAPTRQRPPGCLLCGISGAERSVLWTPCSHSFCPPCILSAVMESGACPACLRRLLTADLRLALPLPTPPRPPARSPPPTPTLSSSTSSPPDHHSSPHSSSPTHHSPSPNHDEHKVATLERRVADLEGELGTREAGLRDEIRRLSAALQAAKILKTSLAETGNIYDVYDEESSDAVHSEAERGRMVSLHSCPAGLHNSTASTASQGSGEEVVSAAEMEVHLAKPGKGVVVEVSRRVPVRPPPTLTIATQTDPVSDDEEESELGPLLPDSKPAMPLLREMDRLEMAAEGFIDDTDLEDQCRETLCNVEYEEISLERARSSERLGLTLCYGTGDDVETDIFVSEIDPNSIAGRDERIKPGDQILQINSVDVMTRNQAIELFRAQSSRVTLLLARTALEPAPSSSIPSVVVEEETGEETMCGEEVGSRAGSAHSGQEKDSGISRTTDSDPELPPPARSPSGLSGSSGTGDSPPADLRLRRLEDHLQGLLGDLLTSPDTDTPTAAPDTPLALSQSAHAESDGSLEKELASLHREMETVRIECDRLIAQHATAEQKVIKQMETANSLMATMDSLVREKSSNLSSPAFTPNRQQPQSSALLQQAYQRMAPSPPQLSRHHRAHHQVSPPDAGSSQLRRVALQRRSGQETSSAYNTGGESCRSTPLNMHPEEKRDSGLYTGFPPFMQQVMVPELSTVLREGQPGSRKGQRQGAEWNNGYHVQKQKPGSSHTSSVACGEEGFRAGQVMYSTVEELEATIALQQKMLRQAMIAQAQELRSSHALGQGPVPSPSASQQMEWKVKRRSDGSRYVTKRPVRNKLLKDRAAQLSSERTGLSTDDDAFSELKVGRYWTREEKKRHVEKSRERKRRQEELLRRRAETTAAATNPDANPIIYLAHKKQMRRKPHQLFDKFTTVQEFLAHGNRMPVGNEALGILSVTTV